MKMTQNELNAMVKSQAIEVLAIPEDAVQTDDYSYAMPFTIDGDTYWAEVVVTAKRNKATKTSAAFDPMAKHEEYLAKVAERELAAATKAAKKRK